MNYKVILVDDEEEVLQSIRRNIDWKSYGFEVVGTFSNGQDVLLFFETQEVDLVITDIRMPFMDGIELSKNIHKHYPQTKVIILSGYGDFNYAKEAMAYRVMDYILKPINAKDMGEVLLRARDVLQKDMEKRRNIEHLKEKYLEEMPLPKENLLHRMAAGDITWPNFVKEFGHCDISSKNASGWLAVLIEADQEEGKSESRIEGRYIPVYIRCLVEEYFTKFCHYSVFSSHKGVCILFGLQCPEDMRKILLHFNGIVKESKKVMDLSLAVGVGKIKDSLLKLQDSYEEAKEAILYHKITKNCGVIYIEDIDFFDQESILFDKEESRMLFAVIKFGSSDDIETAVTQIYDQLKERNMSMKVCQEWLVSELNTMHLIIKQKSMIDVEKIQGQYKDEDSFFQWFMEQCLLIGEYFAKERTDRNQRMIGTVQRYVQKELGNRGITAEWAAEKAGLTTVYFSRLFQKLTGETFTEYLTQLRLEEAVRLLDFTEEKIYAIAEKTGYSDAGYFSYVFQKKYGISPIQRRRQNKREQS